MNSLKFFETVYIFCLFIFLEANTNLYMRNIIIGSSRKIERNTYFGTLFVINLYRDQTSYFI